jgi:hypothetical protein
MLRNREKYCTFSAMSLKFAFLKELSFLKKFGIFIILLILIIFPFFAHPAHANLTITLDSTSSGSGSNTISWKHTTGSNPHTILIVGINAHIASGDISSVTYNNIPLTQLASAPYQYDVMAEQMWYLKHPPSGTHTITINGAANAVAAGAVTFYNVDLNNTFGTTAQNSGVINNPSIPINATTSQLIVDAVGLVGTTDGVSPGNGQTAIWSQGFMGNPEISTLGSSKPGTGGNTTMNWNSITGVWGGIAVALNSMTVIPTPTSTPTPTVTPTPIPVTYTISGNVFNDTNKDNLRDNGEQNYTGAIDITSTGGAISTNNGNFTITGLSPGTYTISYTNLPTGYNMVYPKNGPPPSFLVTVGPSCSTDTTTGASCSNGNITNLNFAITNSLPWVQLIDLDARVDTGFTSNIPASPNPQCGGSAITQDASATTPGTVFTGDTRANFGQGQASSTNWVVGGTTYPEVFTTAPTSLKTSYNYLLTLATKNGLPITDLSTLSSCTHLDGCTLPANLPNGIYQAKGDVTLNAYTFPSNKSYVFLINGTLTVIGPITVPVSSTAFFSAAGDITIDKSVHAVADTCPPPAGQLQGIYSADKDIIIQGNNDCATGQDYMLNVEGNLVVNAARTGGQLLAQRDLCGDNAYYPQLTIRPRPDFLFNLPNFLLQQTTTSQEAAP